MPIFKSVEYTVYCEDCDNLYDFAQYRNQAAAIKFWTSKGWRKKWSRWLCPDCVPYASEPLPDFKG